MEILDCVEKVSYHPLLTDSYQMTMAYSLWNALKTNPDFEKQETFELFFRKNPFRGKFAVVAGINDIIKCIMNWKITNDEIHMLKKLYVQFDSEFFEYLKTIHLNVNVNSVRDGDIVFANEPLVQLTGNFIFLRILETTLLNLVGHSTLITTLASRIKLRSNGKKLFEFGCRRAQGATGALNSAKYSYIAGFDGTSNILAGTLYNIPLVGTHAHSFVMPFIDINDVSDNLIVNNVKNAYMPCLNFKKYVLDIHNEICKSKTNLGELGAFIQYAYTFPSKFLALIDTYNTMESGILNYISVAIGLIRLGYQPRGVRLDSGNLSNLSNDIHKLFSDLSEIYVGFNSMEIVASNDLDESAIMELSQNSKCTAYGIGTNLACSKDQPSLGCVYKLVDRGGIPRMKKSEEPGKTTIPGKKYIFRLFNENNQMLADVMLTHPNIENVCVNNTIQLINPSNRTISKIVTFSSYRQVLFPVIVNGVCQFDIFNPLEDISETRERCSLSLLSIEEKYTRYENPETYMVGIDLEFANLIDNMQNNL